MKELFTAIRLFIVLTLLTGVAYPLVVTGIGQIAFKDKANGSVLTKDGQVVGSSLVGQSFSDAKYFWGRPSATSGFAYNAAVSSGSNLGPTNPALKEAIAERVKALKAADPTNQAPIPTDLVTASGSGLDPHISVAAAEYQVKRVALARGLSTQGVAEAVQKATESRQIGLFGEPVVNVLKLNLELDLLKK